MFELNKYDFTRYDRTFPRLRFTLSATEGLVFYEEEVQAEPAEDNGFIDFFCTDVRDFHVYTDEELRGILKSKCGHAQMFGYIEFEANCDE